MNILITIATIALTASLVFAAQTDCPTHFLSGQAPDFINQKLTTKAQEVCYSGYGLMHSGITRTPIYAAEHLTR
jgi:endonuclease G